MSQLGQKPRPSQPHHVSFRRQRTLVRQASVGQAIQLCLERFPIRLTRKLQGSWPESALDSMFVAFPIGKLVSTIPGNALTRSGRGFTPAQAGRG